MGAGADGRREPPARRLLAGALLAGVAIGIRSQTAVLTLPMLALRAGPSAQPRERIGATGAFAVGVLRWAVPLIVASGGLSAYLEALGAQAGEDFSGVVMLWTHHTRARRRPRAAQHVRLAVGLVAGDRGVRAGGGRRRAHRLARARVRC